LLQGGCGQLCWCDCLRLLWCTRQWCTWTHLHLCLALPPTELPQHLPHLLPAMQHYAWVLRTCHAGAELDTALTMCQGLVDDDLRWVGVGGGCRDRGGSLMGTPYECLNIHGCTKTLRLAVACLQAGAAGRWPRASQPRHSRTVSKAQAVSVLPGVAVLMADHLTTPCAAVCCRWHLYDLAAHRDAWWAPGKVVELRHRLAPYWQAEGASRWGAQGGGCGARGPLHWWSCHMTAHDSCALRS
jgi:hypothetical protein